ncbi:MAG: Gfo/Idh/MocA family protein [Hyphomicrobiales bacterium]
MSSSPVYRGVIVGAGHIARAAHLPAFAASPLLRERVRIVGALDPRPDVEPLDGIPIVRRPEDLAQLGAIDFVDVCTSTASHLDLTLGALRSGYHVLCEKPVALTTVEADRIVDAARAANAIVMPCHQYRHNPAWRAARAWLDADRIGAWRAAEITIVRAHADQGAARSETPWRGRGAESRGGVLLDHGTHWIYLLGDLAGPPRAVRGWTGSLRHAGYDVEDTAHLLLEYPGRVASLFFTWAGWGRETSIRFVGERGTVSWIGGELRLDSETGTERIDMSRELDKARYPLWFAELFERFVLALDRRGAGAGDELAEEALRDVAAVAGVLERAYAPGVPDPREPVGAA